MHALFGMAVLYPASIHAYCTSLLYSGVLTNGIQLNLNKVSQWSQHHNPIIFIGLNNLDHYNLLCVLLRCKS